MPLPYLGLQGTEQFAHATSLAWPTLKPSSCSTVSQGACHSPAAINWQKLSCPACCDEYQQNTQNTFCVYEVLASAAHILKNYLQKSENLANFKGIIQEIC